MCGPEPDEPRCWEKGCRICAQKCEPSEKDRALVDLFINDLRPANIPPQDEEDPALD